MCIFPDLIVLCVCVQMVTMENAEEYVELMFDFCMHTGIQKQMEAFRGEQHYHTPPAGAPVIHSTVQRPV